MKLNFKKFTAGALAATLVLSSSVVAFAADSAEGNTSGTGELEGTVLTDVFNVVLPTVADDDTTFNYILDPEGLIAKTNADRYAGKTFEEGATLYFANSAADAANNYSSKSDALTVVNKSTTDVDVTLSATVSGVDGIVLTGDSTFADDTSTSLYLALMDGTNTAAIDAANGASISAVIGAAPDGAYEYSWNDTEQKYEYELVTGSALDAITFEDYSFQLTGACNSKGNWSGLQDAAPVVSVTWTVKAHQDKAAPSVAQSSYVITAGSAVVVNVDLGVGDLAATGIASVTYKNSTGADKALASSNYTFANGKLTFTSAFVDSLISAGVTSRDYTITFDDAAGTKATVTLATQ